MENNYQKNYGYGKRPLWQWILLYLVIGGIIYFLIYYFLVAKNSGYNYNPSQPQNTGSSGNGVVISKDKILDLSNKGLKSIPSYVFSQTNLEELNVSNNFLTGAIQSQIGNLTNLKILNASNNLMTGVPAEVGQLQNLEILDLSNNKLTGLPNELGNLKNLKTLNISGNQYSQQDLNYIKSKLPSTVNIIVKVDNADAKNATYIIDGKGVALVSGRAEEAISGSVSKIVTQYFGNEVRADFNGDGLQDVAFLLTQNSGGTGTFYYVAVLLSSKNGYMGTNAILLGDRIAPQTTNFTNGEIVVNYADRKPNEPMAVTPSVGVSKYFGIIAGKLVEIKK